MVLSGWLLGGTVGVGTLAYALAIGPLVHLLLPRFTVRPPTAVVAADATGTPLVPPPPAAADAATAEPH